MHLSIILDSIEQFFMSIPIIYSGVLWYTIGVVIHVGLAFFKNNLVIFIDALLLVRN